MLEGEAEQRGLAVLHLHVPPPDPDLGREAEVLPHIPALDAALVNLPARQILVSGLNKLIMCIPRKMTGGFPRDTVLYSGRRK